MIQNCGEKVVICNVFVTVSGVSIMVFATVEYSKGVCFDPKPRRLHGGIGKETEQGTNNTTA